MNDKLALALATLTLIAAFAVLDALTQPLAREMPTACNTVLDLDVLLTSSKIQPFLQCLGARGRSLYFSFYIFDFVAFPVIYATFLHLVLSLIWQERRLALPIAVVVFDVLENAGIVFLLATFPVSSAVVKTLVPWCLRLKWTTLVAIGASTAAGLVARWRGTLETCKQPDDNAQRQKVA